jgi:hypothetical protein
LQQDTFRHCAVARGLRAILHGEETDVMGDERKGRPATRSEPAHAVTAAGRATNEGRAAREWEAGPHGAPRKGSDVARIHEEAAFHHESAAHHHREAARHTRAGDRDDAHRHERTAREHGERASERGLRARAEAADDEQRFEPDDPMARAAMRFWSGPRGDESELPDARGGREGSRGVSGESVSGAQPGGLEPHDGRARRDRD